MTSVLAIDDSRTIRNLVAATLSGAGFDVTTADDGEAGVTLFQEQRFDAVITDINMPRLDGFGVIAAIRANATNRRVPILVLTTEYSAEFKERARQLGATGWIVKPFQDDELIDIVALVTGARNR